jgi:murein DD-endopeptidase MepM/ murein hydrolase activator NlpD
LRGTLSVCCAAVALAWGAPLVHAQAGPSGGAKVPGPPSLRAVECVASPERPCRPAGALLRGREFAVRGGGLEQVSEIVFHGRRGRRDDAHVRPRRAGEAAVISAVPETARSGRLSVVDRYGGRTRTPAPLRVADPASEAPIDIAPSSRFFFDARRKPRFAFDVPRPLEVQVELASSKTGELVRSWTVTAAPGGPNQVQWDGLGPRGVEPLGAYAFRIAGQATGAASQASGTESDFLYADHLFPIRGRHNLGYTDTNNFGDGRGHQGQDMFASCGTRIAAARGGRVEQAGYHSAAGYYVVIDGTETDVDYVYMHMLSAPLVRTRQRVFTGQKIGEVGETGRATGCHLHFEMWSAPGWYQGGRPFDPLPSLKSWDRFS